MGLLTELFFKKKPDIQPLKDAGSFSAYGTIVGAVGSTGGKFAGRTTLVTKTVPAGARVVLERWSARVVDTAGSDQMYFQLCRNGTPISGYERVPGLQFEDQNTIELKEELPPGEISIVAFNMSGMSTSIEPVAIDTATTIQCQAWFTGTLLSERGGI